METSHKLHTWIATVVLVLGFLFGVYQYFVTRGKNQSKINTWENKKQTYEELLTLIGKIGATSDDSLLSQYSKDFKVFYISRIEPNDSVLIRDMMMMMKDIQKSIKGNDDFYQSDKLAKTCTKVSALIREAIENGDEQDR